jgi:hypothetical protein
MQVLAGRAGDFRGSGFAEKSVFDRWNREENFGEESKQAGARCSSSVCKPLVAASASEWSIGR